MAVKLSTGLRNARLGGASLRQIFEDSVIKIYSGTAPSSADDAATGTLLVTISKASGTVSASEMSTAKEAKVTINDHGSGSTYKLTINGTTITYTNTPDLDAAGVAAGLALLIENTAEFAGLVGAHACATAVIYVFSKIRGLTFTIVDGSGTGSLTVADDQVANAQCDALKLGAPSSGVIAKSADVWSGVVANTGTAGYFRMVTSSDDGTSSATQKRLQGNVATSGQELTISSTSLTAGATQTIDTATITEPAS
jgi:hypothetical protein